jgi:hypothetical protein
VREQGGEHRRLARALRQGGTIGPQRQPAPLGRAQVAEMLGKGSFHAVQSW